MPVGSTRPRRCAVRQLEWQIGSQFMSAPPKPDNAIKSSYELESLNLKDEYSESDLKQQSTSGWWISPELGKGCTFADDSVDCVSARHGAGRSLPAPLDQTLLYPEVTGTCPMLVDGGRHGWSPPEVCFDRPPGSSIRVKGK